MRLLSCGVCGIGLHKESNGTIKKERLMCLSYKMTLWEYMLKVREFKPQQFFLAVAERGGSCALHLQMTQTDRAGYRGLRP